jgi:hypothetical protein
VLGAVVVAAVVLAVAGCSAANNKATLTSVIVSGAPGTTEAAAASPSARPGVSPSGVTTRVDAPAQSTEEEYFQACQAAKTWMQDRPGDPQTLVEAYLAAVQAPQATGAGTWNVPWARLSPARQAAVIVAARSAAAGECG